MSNEKKPHWDGIPSIPSPIHFKHVHDDKAADAQAFETEESGQDENKDATPDETRNETPPSGD